MSRRSGSGRPFEAERSRSFCERVGQTSVEKISKTKDGALPPLRSPFLNLGQYASCRSGRKSSVRAVREAVRSRNFRI